MSEYVQLHSRPGAQRCPLCLEDVGQRERRCPACSAGYHPACTEELGQRCAVLGCGGELTPSRFPDEEEGFLDAFDPPRPEAANDELTWGQLFGGALVLPLGLVVGMSWLAEPGPFVFGIAIGLAIAVAKVRSGPD